MWDCKFVSGAFSRLRELHIENCPMLNGHLPENLATLRKLVIRSCQWLVASLRRASDLRFLKTGGFSVDRDFKEVQYVISNIRLELPRIDDWPNME